MRRHLALCVICIACSLVALSSGQETPTATAPTPGSPADLVQQGEKLSRDGKLDDALALYREALEKSADLYEGHLAEGMALDLKGDYTEAHEHLTKAIALAPATSHGQAQRAMAVSYAFEGNAFKAAEFEIPIFHARLAKHDTAGAAEICNELARIYLETGNVDEAYKWYKTGYNTATHKTDLTDANKHLWLFRWESAQARVDARRENAVEAQQHLAAARIALDEAKNPDQEKFYPYLTGYVAFYTGDSDKAIMELQKADQHDPLVMVLLGEAYERLGHPVQAKACYQKVLESNAHNPANAFARPLAKKKLGLSA
jgi:tetratricopeptide (TPR) repeat protein